MLTSNLKSVTVRYGFLKQLIDCFPIYELEVFKQSKNLSNMPANFAVSVASSP